MNWLKKQFQGVSILFVFMEKLRKKIYIFLAEKKNKKNFILFRGMSKIYQSYMHRSRVQLSIKLAFGKSLNISN